jgi:3',5'-cyclic AMP phosphodiesterase CpdA
MARFLQLTDLHVVPDADLVSGVLDTRMLVSSAVDTLLERMSALDPIDAVLVSGDISDDGSAESYEIARSQLDRLGLPLLVVPGNHDRREPMRTAFSDLATMPARGLIDWVTTVGDTTVIGLDTLVEGQGGGELRESSLTLLAQTLPSLASERSVIVMMHHPPMRTGIQFMDAIGLGNLSALEQSLTAAPKDTLILSGHVHGVHHGRIAGCSIITAPSTCSYFALNRRADAPVGFHSGATGYAVLETGKNPLWSAIPLGPIQGPFAF